MQMTKVLLILIAVCTLLAAGYAKRSNGSPVCQEKSSNDRTYHQATSVARHHEADAMCALMAGHDICKHTHHGRHDAYAGYGLEKP